MRLPEYCATHSFLEFLELIEDNSLRTLSPNKGNNMNEINLDVSNTSGHGTVDGAETVGLTLEQLNDILVKAGDKPVTAEELEAGAHTQEDYTGDKAEAPTVH
jgi:hypothetical protein